MDRFGVGHCCCGEYYIYAYCRCCGTESEYIPEDGVTPPSSLDGDWNPILLENRFEGCYHGQKMFVFGKRFRTETAANTWIASHETELMEWLACRCNPWYLVGFCECSSTQHPGCDQPQPSCVVVCPEVEPYSGGVVGEIHIVRDYQRFEGCCGGLRMCTLAGPFCLSSDAATYRAEHLVELQNALAECCGRVPAYIELEIDYGGTVGLYDEHSFMRLPVSCEDITGRCYVSSGRVTVRMDYQGNHRYVYSGAVGDLVESASYFCMGNTDYGCFNNCMTLSMNFTPPISPCCVGVEGGVPLWPEGYCPQNGATPQPYANIIETNHSFTLREQSYQQEDWGCHSIRQTTPLFCCDDRRTVNLYADSQFGEAGVQVWASYGVCINEAAWNVAVPWNRWDDDTMQRVLSSTCPDAVVCMGGDWFYAPLFAVVRVKATIYYQDEVVE